MTCIIGGRCSDGVVLSADRKIVDEDIRDVTYRKKLYQYYYPIVVGSSGHIDPFDNFMKEALEAAQNITPNSPSDINQTYQISGVVHTLPVATQEKSVINLFPYIEKLTEIIRKYRKNYSNYRFDVIFAAQTKERGAFLEYIDSNGLPSNIYNHYKILGSGNIIANALLKSLWAKDMTMEDLHNCVIL
jgi:20S proteasome alpha/beta subunit